jgi:protein gp37
MRMAARLEAMGQDKYKRLTRRSGGKAVWVGKARCDHDALKIPASWKKPRRVFVNSMSDLFHEDVPAKFIREVWVVMALCERHTFQIMTKRPDRMREVLGELPVLPNVWLGTSVENSDYLFRLDQLRSTPAAVRFVSFEPLLGSVHDADLSDIHWAIVGGESGPRARRMEPRWVEEIEGLCRAFGVAFFFKQWGGSTKRKRAAPITALPSTRCPRTKVLVDILHKLSRQITCGLAWVGDGKEERESVNGACTQYRQRFRHKGELRFKSPLEPRLDVGLLFCLAFGARRTDIE